MKSLLQIAKFREKKGTFSIEKKKQIEKQNHIEQYNVMYGDRSAEHPAYDSVTQLYSDAPGAELGIAPLGTLHPSPSNISLREFIEVIKFIAITTDCKYKLIS